MTARANAPERRRSATAAPADLELVVRRIAAFAGARRLVIAGTPAKALDGLGGLETVVAAASKDVEAIVGPQDLALACGEVPLDGLAQARAVLATDLEPAGSALDALTTSRASAENAGLRVAYAGLLHDVAVADRPRRRECPLTISCRPDDEELLRALETGPLSLPLDPAATAATVERRPARVLIASYEVSGPTGNGGIGTAYHSLAHVLAAAGHDVTLLFTGWLEPEQAVEQARWRAAFAAEGIDFQLLGRPWDTPVRSPHHQVRRAYELHRWLAASHTTRPFDVVHVPECQGHGAFALTAKALGLAYHDVEFVVGTHSSTRWVGESNREGLENLDFLVTEHLERLSVERADVVLSPTAYLVDYMRERGWSLPERTFVHPLARPQAVRDLGGGRPPDADHRARRELVFFGRLETRKGVEAFCDAVDELTREDDCPFERVTLLGRPERVTGEEASAYLARRAAAWGLEWQILPDVGHGEAVDYLRRAPCVVAIPSLVDNSPNTVIEAIALGVPFVASRSGGTGELVAPEDLAHATFDGWHDATTLEPPAFADEQSPFDAVALARALRAKATSAMTPAAPSCHDEACDRSYDAWHRAIASRPRPAAADPARELPTAAVCLLARDGDDVHRLAGALARGTRPPTRIAAVCDAPVADPPPDVDVVVASGREAAAARTRIAADMDADVLVVVRGEEDPDPLLVERVCTAMRHGDADVLSLITRDPDASRDAGTAPHLRRDDVPGDLRAFVPVGGPPLAAAAYPALTVGPYAIRREALARLGGYAPDLWGESLDHELLTRAALDGMRIDVLPDPVATTGRDDRWTELRSRHWGSVPVPAPHGEEQIRLLRPFRRRLDDELADLPALFVGALRSTERVHDEVVRREQLVDAYEARVAEQRELIELYERQKEELRTALASPPPVAASGRAGRVRRRLHRALRPPISALPMRALRFARWRVTLLARRIGR